MIQVTADKVDYFLIKNVVCFKNIHIRIFCKLLSSRYKVTTHILLS